MLVVTMVAVIVVAVVEVLVCAAGIIDMVVVAEGIIDVLTGEEIIVVGDVIVIVSKLALKLSYSCFAFADVMVDVLSGIEIEELADVNASVIVAVMTALGFPVSTPLGGFSR